jgi:DNA-binding CsgD family transcriptional regulator
LAKNQELVKTAISRVVTLREPQDYEAANDLGEYYHVSLWPLNTPDIAVCLLSMPIPSELALLTARERDCLKLLSRGCGASAIATDLDVSVSTIHTHLRRAREKLNLPTVESLISYAARYCYRPQAPLMANLCSTV